MEVLKQEMFPSYRVVVVHLYKVALLEELLCSLGMGS